MSLDFHVPGDAPGLGRSPGLPAERVRGGVVRRQPWSEFDPEEYGRCREQVDDLPAANIPVLGPGEVVADSRVPRPAEALAWRDVVVHTLDFDAVPRFPGGFRCSHHPLRRTPDRPGSAARTVGSGG
ncbi:hypothetical protein [Yinghuangia sp. YIM S09857]|uniref:hypothetical protein n=1 Tax=Yinghuangia sp. YIM S09857 TaxID=3436929 RepID=UPI003F53B97D